ncbi:MAG: type II toxin-antitoxin system RelE/ParE family toxin [Bacteroidia bacterium]
MKILWSDFSIQMLSAIYTYYKQKGSRELAQRITKDILSATKQLKDQPLSGQIEPGLVQLGEGHRL